MSANQGEAQTLRRLSGFLWAGLAVLSCPCHFPILALALAGTAGGAFLWDHRWAAALGMTGLFLLSLQQARRAFRKRS
ncbi:broad-spectrum mercury transporter MerE [Methylacidimicrobium sp. AP8]|uniref:broad-spectrum mercury transporter MerE n=1 Tax=Methylacidimicrobium sp. AP8 TaxID=2730359 RepID=UPI0019224267|nr:broad-spectrum mercury transporter MerE [Methylacidimicrobium sp. AP8]